MVSKLLTILFIEVRDNDVPIMTALRHAREANMDITFGSRIDLFRAAATASFFNTNFELEYEVDPSDSPSRDVSSWTSLIPNCCDLLKGTVNNFIRCPGRAFSSANSLKPFCS